MANQAATTDQEPFTKEGKKLSKAQKDKLYEKYIVPHYNDIRSLTIRYTDKYQDVDDNYNYVLIQLYNYIATYDESKSLNTWIHICTKRACYKQNKKRATLASYYTDVQMCTEAQLHSNMDNVVEPVIGMLADNVSDTIYNALMQIPPHRLSPFLLYAQGYGLREITAMEWNAGHLNKRSVDVVRSRIYWARRELQYILRKYGIERKGKEVEIDD